jgi:hypothetical protein
MLLGIVLNLAIGAFVDKVPAIYAVLISSGLCVGSPLLMAVINPKWPYWYDAFFAQVSDVHNKSSRLRGLTSFPAALAAIGRHPVYNWPSCRF